MTRKFKILNTLDFTLCPKALDVFDGVGEVKTLPWCYDTVRSEIHMYDAYLASTSVVLDADMLSAAKRLLVVGSPATGTDHLDLATMKKMNITCFDISREHSLIESFTATSELAFGLLLSINRQLVEASQSTRQGLWERERFTGFQLSGKTFGCLGLGRLGTISSKIAQGFGMRVIAHDIDKTKTSEGVGNVSLEELFRSSDVVSIHVHLNDSTRGMVNANLIKMMKENAILINTSRGAIVDETALLTALREKNIAGAGLDIINGEWADTIGEHPLIAYSRDHGNLLITPHIGGATIESITDARVFMANKVANFLKNAATEN
ncbi:MAG: hypothetical protein CMF46_05945 [Legionellales bacterium]|nr:hypothetical protein [Legionellales bacterium]